MRSTPSTRQIAGAQQRGLVIMHGLVALIFGMIALGIILLVVGLVALCNFVVTSTTIMVSIVLMTTVRLAIVPIALVALMVIAIFVATMLLVAQFTAMCGRKMSRFLFLRMLLVLGDLL
jgi:hypothetical protein